MAVQNSLVQQPTQEKKQPFSAVINSSGYKKLINSTLGDQKRADRFVTSIVSAVAVNSLLQECTPSSIISAGLLGTSLELAPSPQLGYFYMVPYKQKEKRDKDGNIISPEHYVAQFQLGVNGYKQLAIRSGQYLDIEAVEIREGEYRGRNKENGKPIFEFIEDETVRENTPIIGYLAYFELLCGFKKSVYFSLEKMLNHADRYSAAFSKEKYLQLREGKIPKGEMWKYSSPWYTSFDSMALKTVIRQLISKWGVLSIDMQTAVEKDGAYINDNGQAEYLDLADDEQPIGIDAASGEVIAEADADPAANFFDENN